MSVTITVDVSILSMRLKPLYVLDALEKKDACDRHPMKLAFAQTALTICSTPPADRNPIGKGRINFDPSVALRTAFAQILYMGSTTAMGRREPPDL